MATQTLADVEMTGTFEDVIATHAAAASVDVLLQNVGPGLVAVVFGGGEPTGAGKSGVVLSPLDSVEGNAAAIWIRAVEGAGKLGVTLL